MAVSLSLAQDRLTVEPGSAATITLTLTQTEARKETYEIDIEGVDPDWKILPSGTFTLDPHESHVETLFLKPPRETTSVAGEYPFVVRVRSLDSGESRTVGGILVVKGFHLLSADVDPKKGYVSPFKRHNAFDVQIMNLGNQEHTVQLTGSDPEDALAFEFAENSVAIAPGQQRRVEVEINPTSTPFLTSGRLYGFSVMARSSNVPSVVAAAQGQIEQRGVLSPLSLALLVLVAGLIGAWIWAMPKAPTITLNADPTKVVRGESVTLKWNAREASKITILQDGTAIHSSIDLAGTHVAKIEGTRVTRFQAKAERNGMTGQSDTVTVTIQEPERVPEARIEDVETDKRSVRLGDSFVLRFKFRDAQSARLFPDNVELDPNSTSITVTPMTTGKVDYEIVAYNKEAKATKRAFSVNVYDESTARIERFVAGLTRVVRGELTRVAWSVTGATVIELKIGSAPFRAVGSSGEEEITVTEPTAVILKATDDRGRSVTRRIRLTAIDPPKPKPDDPDTPPDPDDPDSGVTVEPGFSTTGGGGTPPPS